jgi:hypothetical protein
MTEYVDDRPPAGQGARRYPQASPWVGWIAFAGILMVILGALHAFQGLVAIFKDEYFLVSPSGLAVKLDFTTWGWMSLIVGVIVVVAGICVLGGQMWARVVGVALAALSILGNVAFLAAYPLWSLIMIALDIVIIMALTVHGSDIKPGS